EVEPSPAKQRYGPVMDPGSPPLSPCRRSGRLAGTFAILAGCAQASIGGAPGDSGMQGGDACADCVVSDWQYRAPITFEAPAAGSDVPILVVLDAASFMYAHAAADGSDLRFSSDDDSLVCEIPHWIESWTAGGTSLVWMRVPSVVAGMNTVWAFYGHRTGVATSDDFAMVFPNTMRTMGNAMLSGTVSHDA